MIIKVKSKKKFGEKIFGKSCQLTLWIPWGSKICQNLSISHRFRDKCVYAFYSEIQDGLQKLRANDFSGRSPVDSADTQRTKNVVEIALSQSFPKINASLSFTQIFKAENDFGEKSPDDSVDTLLPRALHTCTIENIERQKQVSHKVCLNI